MTTPLFLLLGPILTILLTTLPQKWRRGLPPTNTIRVLGPRASTKLVGQDDLGKPLLILVAQEKVSDGKVVSRRLPTRRVGVPRAARWTKPSPPGGLKPGTKCRPNVRKAVLEVSPLSTRPSRETNRLLRRWQIPPSLMARQFIRPSVPSSKKKGALQRLPRSRLLRVAIIGVNRRRLFTTRSRILLKGRLRCPWHR